MAGLDNLTTLKELIPALIETGSSAYAADFLDLEIRRADPRDTLLGQDVLDKYRGLDELVSKVADLLETDVAAVRMFTGHLLCSRRFYGEHQGRKFYSLVIQRIFPGHPETQRHDILEAVMATLPRR